MIKDEHLLSRDAQDRMMRFKTIAYEAVHTAFNLPQTTSWIIAPQATTFEQTFAPVYKRYACKKGCSHCCHQSLMITEPEAVSMAKDLKFGFKDHPEVMAEIISALRNRVDEIGDIPDRHTYHRLHLTCIFLQPDQTCGIYNMRPHVCREHNSLNLDDCKKAEVDPAHPVTHDMNATYLAAAQLRGLIDAVWEHGLTCRLLEFNHALLTALEHDDCENAWLRGENPFKDVRSCLRRPGDTGDKVFIG